MGLGFALLLIIIYLVYKIIKSLIRPTPPIVFDARVVNKYIDKYSSFLTYRMVFDGKNGERISLSVPSHVFDECVKGDYGVLSFKEKRWRNKFISFDRQSNFY